MSAERKEAARKFNEVHSNSQARKANRSKVLRRLTNNDLDKIPQHGRRANTSHRQPIDHGLLRSTRLSQILADQSNNALHSSDWLNGIGTHLVSDDSLAHVVIDTNVITSAIGTPQISSCREIFDECINGQIKPCVTHSLVSEYRYIIRLGFLENGIKIDQMSLQLLDEFLGRCLVLTDQPHQIPPQIKADPSDRMFLIAQALAEEKKGKNCFVVSLDHHLLDMASVHENIIHPANFVNLLARGLLAL